MKINYKILDQVRTAGKQLVVVTKYLAAAETQAVMNQLQDSKEVYGFGENRIETLEIKQLPREKTHFIGRIQSRKIPQIVHYCETIHSLEALSHAIKISQVATEKKLLIKLFVQVNISEEDQKGGVEPVELPEFLHKVNRLESLEIIGLSGMGRLRASPAIKAQEFGQLKTLRDQHLPSGLISAGTSSDYPLALEAGIDIVRVGRALWVSDTQDHS